MIMLAGVAFLVFGILAPLVVVARQVYRDVLRFRLECETDQLRHHIQSPMSWEDGDA